MEALRGGLHEHKENVEANISRGKLTYNGELPGKAGTPAGKLPFSTPKSTKVADKISSTAKKPRRALGDISNQHRTPNNNKSGTELLGKRGLETPVKANLKSTTPASAKKARTSVSTLMTPKRATPAPEPVEDIEFAYGGLPSYGPDPSYLERIRREIVNELLDDETPTVMDEYKAGDQESAQWEPEIAMLSNGTSPSPWWSTESSGETSFAETVAWSDDSIPSTVDLNTPEPDVCDELPADPENDLLDELLSIDIPVAIE